ncbi:MAG: imidazole glycerol phosphate synthase cyclase subunit [Bdellovibrionota bacterium]
MPKKRLIASILVLNDLAVQSIGFGKYLPIGKPAIAVEYLNQWGIDEITILDINPDRQETGPNISVISEAAKHSLVPLTYGGGISTVKHMREAIKNGADKVSINTAAIKNPSLINEGASVFGDQAIIVSLDCKEVDGSYKVFINSGKTEANIELIPFLKQCEDLGAGEFLISSIDHDGSKKGFDIPLINTVSKAVKIPVIAFGGANQPSHFETCFKETEVTAAAAGNMFNYIEHSVILVKKYLRDKGIDVRLDTYASYEDHKLSRQERLLKKEDQELLNLRFTHVEEEVI